MLARGRRLPRLALALLLALAVPLAVVGWLAGGHVTPEQSLRHAQAVAEHGLHDHGESRHGHHLVARPAAEGVIAISADGAHAFAYSLWQAVAAAALLLLAPLAGRAALATPAARPPVPALAVATPPPRRPI